MKKPELKNLNVVATEESPNKDHFKEAVTEQKKVAELTVRKTYSLERHFADHIDAEAARLTAEQGKVVNASQALRTILTRDMSRASS